jgi:hypothetical protein
VFEIGCVLTGGIDADVEVRLGVLLVEGLEAFVQRLIAGPVFQDGEGFGSGRAIGSQEGDPMTVACGVDADAKAVEGRSGGQSRTPETRECESALVRCGGEAGVSILRES